VDDHSYKKVQQPSRNDTTPTVPGFEKQGDQLRSVALEPPHDPSSLRARTAKRCRSARSTARSDRRSAILLNGKKTAIGLLGAVLTPISWRTCRPPPASAACSPC
jgi:hypothetical protein